MYSFVAGHQTSGEKGRTAMDTVKRYLEILHKAQAQGDTNQVRHLEGWRAAKNTTMCLLYTQGKVSLAQVMEWAKPKPKDHLARVEIELAKGITEAVAFAQELMSFGIDPEKLDRVRRARITKLQSQADGLRAEIATKRPKELATIIHNGIAAVQRSEKAPVELTEQQLRVQIACLEAANRAAAKKLAEAPHKKGFEVTLTEAEKAALLASLLPPKQVIK